MNHLELFPLTKRRGTSPRNCGSLTTSIVVVNELVQLFEKTDEPTRYHLHRQCAGYCNLLFLKGEVDEYFFILRVEVNAAVSGLFFVVSHNNVTTKFVTTSL